MDTTVERTLLHPGARLTRIEHELLVCLADADGGVVSHETLQAAIGYSPEANTTTVQTHICWLRRKLRIAQIVTVRRTGYRLLIQKVAAI